LRVRHNQFCKTKTNVVNQSECDVGKLYFHLQNQETWFLRKGRKMLIQQRKILSSICEEVPSVHLSKYIQCSDWEQRRVIDYQTTYVVADAHCLLVIFNVFYQNFLVLHKGGQARSEAIIQTIIPSF